MKTKNKIPSTEENLMRVIRDYLIWLDKEEEQLDDLGNYGAANSVSRCSCKLRELLNK